jgi:tol-pal system protein YbgF
MRIFLLLFVFPVLSLALLSVRAEGGINLNNTNPEREEAFQPLAQVPSAGPERNGPSPLTPSQEAELPGATLLAQASAFDRGKALFDQKEYSRAMRQFKDYLSAFPCGSQAALSQYYIGECFFFQNQYGDAIIQYEKVLRYRPNDMLVAAVLLKQGMAFQDSGDPLSACILYRKVIQEHPNTPSAAEASGRLGTVKGGCGMNSIG